MHDYKHEDLEAYLATHVPGFGRLDGFKKFSDGQSNPTYCVRSGATEYVLRAKPLGDLLPSAHAVDREFQVMQALANTDVPVPGVFHLSGNDTPLGAMFFVMQKVPGEVLWDPALPKATQAERTAIYNAMNQVLATLHGIDVEAAGLAEFGRPGNYFERQTARWRKQYRLAETDALPDADWVMDWLDAHMVPDDGTVAIAHGDYRIDNMIFQGTGIAALLDWELSTLGHPLADLAYQVMVWQLPNEGRFRGLAGLDRSKLGLPSDADYVAQYCNRRGISVPDNWSFYLVFSMFRFMAILQGVLKRGLDGSASNPYGAGVMRNYVEEMARLARAEASKM